MSNQHFGGPKALADIESIVAHLRKANSGTVKQISEATGLSRNQVSDYLQHMRQDEQVMVSDTLRGSHHARVWVLGVDPKVVADQQRKVVVKTSWDLNLCRDTLVSALFGAPAAMQGVSA